MKFEKQDATDGKGDFALYTILFEHFPTWLEQIPLLMERDETFAEICADFEELIEWLADNCHDDDKPESECAANRQLLAELEIEILQILQAVNCRNDHQI